MHHYSRYNNISGYCEISTYWGKNEWGTLSLSKNYAPFFKLFFFYTCLCVMYKLYALEMSYLGYVKRQRFELFWSVKNAMDDDDMLVPVDANPCQRQQHQQQRHRWSSGGLRSLHLYPYTRSQVRPLAEQSSGSRQGTAERLCPRSDEILNSAE